MRQNAASWASASADDTFRMRVDVHAAGSQESDEREIEAFGLRGPQRTIEKNEAAAKAHADLCIKLRRLKWQPDHTPLIVMT